MRHLAELLVPLALAQPDVSGAARSDEIKHKDFYIDKVQPPPPPAKAVEGPQAQIGVEEVVEEPLVQTGERIVAGPKIRQGEKVLEKARFVFNPYAVCFEIQQGERIVDGAAGPYRIERIAEEPQVPTGEKAVAGPLRFLEVPEVVKTAEVPMIVEGVVEMPEIIAGPKNRQGEKDLEKARFIFNPGAVCFVPSCGEKIVEGPQVRMGEMFVAGPKIQQGERIVEGPQVQIGVERSAEEPQVPTGEKVVAGPLRLLEVPVVVKTAEVPMVVEGVVEMPEIAGEPPRILEVPVGVGTAEVPRFVRAGGRAVPGHEPLASQDSGCKVEPKTEDPRTEEPKAQAPKTEEPKAEEPKAEAPKAEEPRAEEAKSEAPKVEEPKTEEPKAGAPKAEEPKAIGPKAEAPKAEEPRATAAEGVNEEFLQRFQGEEFRLLPPAEVGRFVDAALAAWRSGGGGRAA